MLKRGLMIVAVVMMLGSLSPLAASAHKERGEREFKGVVEQLPGNLIGAWKVSGRTVHVGSAGLVQQREGRATVGAYVEVKGSFRADGSITATSVKVERQNDRAGRESRDDRAERESRDDGRSDTGDSDD